MTVCTNLLNRYSHDSMPTLLYRYSDDSIPIVLYMSSNNSITNLLCMYFNDYMLTLFYLYSNDLDLLCSKCILIILLYWLCPFCSTCILMTLWVLCCTCIVMTQCTTLFNRYSHGYMPNLLHGSPITTTWRELLCSMLGSWRSDYSSHEDTSHAWNTGKHVLSWF